MSKNTVKSRKIRKMFRLLDKRYGDLKWWPARSRFEVIVGAILTQNTAWKNVEKAISELRKEKLLVLENMNNAKSSVICRAVRSSGYYRQKTEKLRNVCSFLLAECGKDLRRGKSMDADILREKLLALKGIGPETADSIMLYAFEKPFFVVDAYTTRIFARHGLIEKKASYYDVQKMVHLALGRDVSAFNQFHAGLVEAGKCFCSKKGGKCGECPLNALGVLDSSL